VLAELVQRRAAGEFTLATPAAAPAATEVLDPVCGMTVTADDAHFPVEHAGTTYWFCRVACSQAFAADPAQYLSEAEA
jgi:YHS domain-containing protein